MFVNHWSVKFIAIHNNVPQRCLSNAIAGQSSLRGSCSQSSLSWSVVCIQVYTCRLSFVPSIIKLLHVKFIAMHNNVPQSCLSNAIAGQSSLCGSVVNQVSVGLWSVFKYIHVG